MFTNIEIEANKVLDFEASKEYKSFLDNLLKCVFFTLLNNIEDKHQNCSVMYIRFNFENSYITLIYHINKNSINDIQFKVTSKINNISLWDLMDLDQSQILTPYVLALESLANVELRRRKRQHVTRYTTLNQ